MVPELDVRADWPTAVAANRVLIRVLFEAAIEAVGERRASRQATMVEAAERILSAEVAAASVVPIRGFGTPSRRKAVMEEAWLAFEEMRPALIAKVPPPDI